MACALFPAENREKNIFFFSLCQSGALHNIMNMQCFGAPILNCQKNQPESISYAKILSINQWYKLLHIPTLLIMVFSSQDAAGYAALHGAVQGARDGAVLRVPGVLRGPVVPGRVLVLQRLHALHADRLRGHARAAAAQEHGRDQKDGKQALPHTGGL